MLNCEAPQSNSVSESSPGQMSINIRNVTTSEADDDRASAISSLSGTVGHDSDWFYNNGTEGWARFSRTARLYGRTREVSILFDAFTRARNGPSEVVLISGEAGTGKSKVAESLRGPVTSTESNGYFVAGKYDQLRLDKPFSAIVNAFNDLAEIICLTEDSQSRRNYIKEALGDEADLLCKLIPNLSLLIEHTKNSKEEVNFNMIYIISKLSLAFRKLLGVVATKESPLCIFLDDIQWADPESMHVIRDLMTDIRSHHVLLVFGYRGNELNMAKVEEIFQCSDEVKRMDLTTILIGNLDVVSVHELILDQLEMTAAEESMVLSKCIWKKTLGNPFFVLEFLDELLDRGFMVQTDSSLFIDIEKIQNETNVSSNVVSIICKRLNRLHANVRAVLVYAAYLGFHFGIDELKAIVISEHEDVSPILPRSDVGNDGITSRIEAQQYHEMVDRILHAATAEGIIEKCDDAGIKMKFVHDYLQTVLYDSIPEGQERAMIHLRIGRRIRESMLPKSNDFLFAIVYHLNHASSCLEEVSDLVELSRLNLSAAKLAISEKSTYLSASDYLQCAIRLLDPETMWNIHYDLCLEMHGLSAITTYCIGDFESSNMMVKSILKNGRTIEDKACAYYAEIDALNAQAMQMQSIEKGLSILRMLGMKIKRKPSKFTLFCQILKIKQMLGRKSDEFIMSIPLLANNVEVVMITTILTKIMTAALFVGEMNLRALAILKIFQLSLQKGVSDMTPPAIAAYGAIESKLGNTESASRFGMLALKLMNKLCATKTTCLTMIISVPYAMHWKLSLPDSVEHLRKAFRIGIAQGDMDSATKAAVLYIIASFHCGKNLQTLDKECQILCESMQSYKQAHSLDILQQFWWAITSLMGSPDHENQPLLWQSDATNKATMAARDRSQQNIVVLFSWLSKLVTAFHCGHLATAEDMVAKLEVHKTTFKGHFIDVWLHFYSGLTFYGLALTAINGSQQRNNYQQRGDKVQSFFRMLKNKGYPTALLFLAVLEAERMALTSNDANKVLQAYKHAIDLSASNGFVNYEGFANERACFVLHELGINARPFFDRAVKCYVDWGAYHKVQIIERDFDSLIAS